MDTLRDVLITSCVLGVLSTKFSMLACICNPSCSEEREDRQSGLSGPRSWRLLYIWANKKKRREQGRGEERGGEGRKEHREKGGILALVKINFKWSCFKIVYSFFKIFWTCLQVQRGLGDGSKYSPCHGSMRTWVWALSTQVQWCTHKENFPSEERQIPRGHCQSI